MPLQSPRLAMIALGAQSQPPLADGIHLRWSFDRDLGFPWHGFYLFRREARPGKERCFGTWWPNLFAPPVAKEWQTDFGRISSDVVLTLTGGTIDLAGRKSLRFDFTPGTLARRVKVAIRWAAAPAKTCEGMASAETLPNPFIRNGLKFEVSSAPNVKAPAATIVASRGLAGLDCGFSTSIDLPAIVDRAWVTIFHADITPTLRAFDQAGTMVAQVPGRAEWWTPYTVELMGKRIARVVVEGRGATYMPQVCYAGTSPSAPPEQLRVRALDGKTTVVEKRITSVTSMVELIADRMTAIEIDGGVSASIADLCYVPVDEDALEGWTAIPGVNPILLPVETSLGYPAAGAPATPVAARTLALGRIKYGPAWAANDARYDEIHEQLKALVKNGPAGGAMAARSVELTGAADPKHPNAPPAKMPKQRPLDLLLLGALHPPIAQLLGLYHIDNTVAPNTAFDYLIVADHDGRFGGNEKTALQLIATAGFGPIDGWICFGLKKAPAPPLPPPENVRAFALPGATRHENEGAQNGTGLQWQLQPGSPIVMADIWRRDYGATVPANPDAAPAFTLITAERAVLVTRPAATSPHDPHGPADWPPSPPQTIDAGLNDGWYGYRLTGTDIFGRISAQSADAEWWQWAPTPAPRPWYYTGPASDAKIHPFAIRLLDKIPPPPPTGIQAEVLDPADPYLLKDAAYTAWRNNAGPSVVGLRVKWRWTSALAIQAPDAAEFRVYFHPGSQPPSDTGEARTWAVRCFVKNIAQHSGLEPGAGGARLFDVFIELPPAFKAPAAANPIVYGQVSVSTADDKTHTADDPAWNGSAFGNRTGNEGRVGTPVTVFRVLRTLPAPPDPASDDVRLFASPADYRSASYFTFQWRPAPNLKTHIYRALDESVFLADWAKRKRPPMTATDPAFPNTPRWNLAKRAAVIGELNALNSFTDAGQAMAAYRALSDDALRVLASQKDVADAFVQITIEPLDPDAPANANRRGPDKPDSFVLDPALRAFIDKLDGRARNRYLYRATYVDGAHNRSDLGVAGPPVYLPRVTPPKAPVITRITGGDRSITIAWASNRDPDLARYLVYRADSEDQARDIRLMKLVQTVTVAAGDPMKRPASVSWPDTAVPAKKTVYYAVAAVDTASNQSPPSRVVAGMAYDYSPPAAPVWLRSEWIRVDVNGIEHPFTDKTPGLIPAVALSLKVAAADVSVLIERRAARWNSISGWTRPVLDSTTQTWRITNVDRSARPDADQSYRIQLVNPAGLKTESPVRVVAKP